MLKLLSLFLPAILPSWRFFDRVMPSPRIEVALLVDRRNVAADEENKCQDAPKDDSREWREFSPLPEHISVPQMLGRMFWNQARNEALFLVSLAERVVAQDSAYAKREMAARIRRGLCSNQPFFQYRLVFVERQNGALVRDVCFVSEIYPAHKEIVS